VDETSVVMPVTLSNGTQIFVEVTPRGHQKVGDLAPIPFDSLMKTIEAVASEFGNLLTKVAPDKASVELGVEIAAEPGRLTAILVKGTAKANLTITLEWQKAGTAAK